ncbi:hypothetical protein BD779DRAFT_1439437 [Infundibulicybe gibba]|nr:hypothetical protein BD779DRAFT_1439437 [Infundibulicybe gibba]
MNSELNISLEPHLLESLKVLPLNLPSNLADLLGPYIGINPPATIPYSTLRAISTWSRTEAGVQALRKSSPPLDPSKYTMISLLAGTTTSPERKFPTHVPEREPQDIAAEQAKERKSITALLNALLSIGGSGFAVWWAAEKLHWRNEWRVLLALFAAIIVAVAEAVLLIIWQSRQAKKPSRPSALHKRHERDLVPGDSATVPAPPEAEESSLRRRR